MNIFLNIWNNWSTYEKIQEAILLSVIVLLCLAAIYFATKDKRILLLSGIAFFISTILYTVGILLTNTLFDIQITEIFRLIPILTYILILSNLGVFVGFFLYRKNRKDFNIVDVRKEYLSDSTKQTIFLLLLGSSIFMFVSVQTQAILVVSILSCLSGIWGIYWISKYILK
jgi:hypothetical protein